MPITNKQKEQRRSERLARLPKQQRSVKLALIKKKEGRVLNATEKHALAMQSTPGKILKAWEVIRSGATGSIDTAPVDAEAREKQIDELLQLLFENWPSYVRTPKVSRVIQSCIKHGTTEQHAAILNKMILAVAEYSCDAFAHHVLLCLLRHAKSRETFDDLLAGVLPVACQIAATKHGFSVLSSCYSSKFATQEHRNFIVAHACVPNASVAALRSAAGYPDLEKMLAADPTGALLLRTRVVLSKIVDKLMASAATATGTGAAAAAATAAQQQQNKLGAELLETSYAHRLLRVYLTAICSAEDIPDTAGTLCQVLGAEGAVAEALLHALLVQAQTKDSAESCCIAFAVAAPALRRPVLRQLATHFSDVVLSKFGSPFVARVLDFAYDPQLVTKFLVAPFSASVGKILSSPYAPCILLHALTPSLQRKSRALLPVFLGINLYSRENPSWAGFATADKTTVQCCDAKQHPAERSHAFFLAGVLPAVAQWAEEAQQQPAAAADGAAANDDDDDDKKKKKDGKNNGDLNSHARLALCRVAKELHHLQESKDPLLAAIFSHMEGPTAKAVMAKLKEYVPKNIFRDEKNGNGAADASSTSTGATVAARRPRSASASAKPVVSTNKKAVVASKAKQQQQQQQPAAAAAVVEDDDAPRVKNARQKPVIR